MSTATLNGKHEAATVTATKGPKQSAVVKQIEIPGLRIQRTKIRLVGTSPLVTHAWSDKAKKMMLDKQMKVPKQGKAAKDPMQDVFDSLYWISKKPTSPLKAALKAGKFGFPAIGFKSAAVDACSFVDGITKVEARGAFHIDAQLIEIECEDGPEPDESMVRIAMGTADIRYRARFDKWAVELPISYNEAVLSPDQIVHLFNVAGFAVGVGEHRPQCNGGWGRFEVQVG